MLQEYRELCDEHSGTNMPEHLHQYIAMRKDFQNTAEMWEHWWSFVPYQHSREGDAYYGVLGDEDEEVTFMYFDGGGDQNWTDVNLYLQMRSEYRTHEEMSSAIHKWMTTKEGRESRFVLHLRIYRCKVQC